MNSIKTYRQEHGYTLIETVVAMALFLSVLIPIAMMIGNFILDDSAHRMNIALLAAQTEISRVVSERDYTSGMKKDDQGLRIERNIEHNGNLLNVRVMISTIQHPEKALLVLRRSFLVRE